MSDFLSLKKAEVKKKTFETYQSKIRYFCAYMELKGYEKIDVSAITDQIITDFLVYMTEKKQLTKASVEKYEQIIRTFFDYLKKKKLIKFNPAEDLPKIGLVKDCAPYPIRERDRQLLAKKIKQRDRQLWLACCMMFYSALRPGEEIRLLKVSNINMESRKITIKSENAKGNRTDSIDMPEQLYRELLFHKIELANPDDYVFGQYGRTGTTYLGKNTLRNRFNRIRDELKLSKTYKFYSWKHTGAEILADSGASTWELQAHLRHRSIDTTERYARKRLGRRNEKFINNFPDIE